MTRRSGGFEYRAVVSFAIRNLVAAVVAALLILAVLDILGWR